MPSGPSLLFDKSSLESLNLDEAVLLDNFYLTTLTPLFYVECLADLEKTIRSKSTPEQLVGSLADRTPEEQSHPNVHHLTLLKAELSGQFDLRTVEHRVVVSGGERVQLGDKKGLIIKHGPEEEALERWRRREFLQLERNTAQAWRRALTHIDFEAMVRTVMNALGHWRKPTTLEDAKNIVDVMVDNLEAEWLLRFGLDLLGIPESTEWALCGWQRRRRPPLREDFPYFTHLLTINLFFCIVLPQQLLRDVKSSHQVDLAYLYYLPFCSIFTSKDNFHIRVAPLFLDSSQEFVNGNDLKLDLKNLDALYSTFPQDVLATGLINFAAFPPDDGEFLVTKMWDKFLPEWRNIKTNRQDKRDPAKDKQLGEHIDRLSKAPKAPEDDETNAADLHYTMVSRMVSVKKGKWLRFSEEDLRKAKKKAI